MRMRDFISQNRTEIDAAINGVLTFVPRTASCYCHLSGTDRNHEPGRLNNREREQLIANDEGLYNWARREGVNV